MPQGVADGLSRRAPSLENPAQATADPPYDSPPRPPSAPPGQLQAQPKIIIPIAQRSRPAGSSLHDFRTPRGARNPARFLPDCCAPAIQESCWSRNGKVWPKAERQLSARASELLPPQVTGRRLTTISADMPQNHHYLPQSYQRGWADTNGQVHVYQWRHNKLVCKPKSTRSTGAEPDLYAMPMALPELRNLMEDKFWREIDQWGADGPALLKSADPAAASKLNKPRLATFIMSLLWRNPRDLEKIDAEANIHVTRSALADDYAANRRSHEPDTFEEFKVLLDQPGLSEFGAQIVRSFVRNQPIRDQLLSMTWEVVSVTDAEPILTSDVPIIRYRGLKEPDGLLMLPLSPDEFFVAYNQNGIGEIDMRRSIDQNIRSGVFIEAMNRYTVQHRHNYVYGKDASQFHYVARHWMVSEAPA